jgi:hypothetical protein
MSACRRHPCRPTGINSVKGIEALDDSVVPQHLLSLAIRFVSGS